MLKLSCGYRRYFYSGNVDFRVWKEVLDHLVLNRGKPKSIRVRLNAS